MYLYEHTKAGTKFSQKLPCFIPTFDARADETSESGFYCLGTILEKEKETESLICSP